jgi:hypothetical protein
VAADEVPPNLAPRQNGVATNSPHPRLQHHTPVFDEVRFVPSFHWHIFSTKRTKKEKHERYAINPTEVILGLWIRARFIFLVNFERTFFPEPCSSLSGGVKSMQIAVL